MGSLRTALVAWLFARSRSARFLIRVEDLDRQRCRPEFERHQLADLRALGLVSDAPPVRQSDRLELYAAALNRLEREDRTYPCFCTRADIRAAASAPHGPATRSADPAELPAGAYPGTCRALGAVERARRLAAGDPHALRLRADAARVRFDDALLGTVTGVVDDFVVRRADGVFAYQLAVVVDDAEQGIGEVVRGADLAESTPRQIVLQELLGLPRPAYAHVALVLGPDGERLAKRDRAATLADRNEPASVTLAQLAHTLGLAAGRAEVAAPDELLGAFDPGRLPREAVTLGGDGGDPHLHVDII